MAQQAFYSLKIHFWLSKLFNDFCYLNQLVNFNCDLLLTLAI